VTGTEQRAARSRARRPGRRTVLPGWLALCGAGCVLGTAAVAAGAFAGVWFLPFVAGMVVAVPMRSTGRRARPALAMACLIALAGWILPLLIRLWAEGEPVGATARTVAALAGLPPYAAVTVAAVLLVAVLQGAAGWWLGWALAGLARPLSDQQ
jgi:hypothetical protein